MYGITMEESGISKVVSVKFAKNKQEHKQLPLVKLTYAVSTASLAS